MKRFATGIIAILLIVIVFMSVLLVDYHKGIAKVQKAYENEAVARDSLQLKYDNLKNGTTLTKLQARIKARNKTIKGLKATISDLQIRVQAQHQMLVSANDQLINEDVALRKARSRTH